jgi:hypothetical protein
MAAMRSIAPPASFGGHREDAGADERRRTHPLEVS